MKNDITQLSEAINQLPPTQMTDLFDLMSENIMAMANQGQLRNASDSGHLMACSKHLEQASTEISRFAQNQQADNNEANNNKQNTMNNKNPKRLKRVLVAQDTLDIIKRGNYQHPQSGIVDLQDDIDACVQQTQLFSPEQLASVKPTLPDYKIR